jgi:protein-tyrosine phosphatase
MTNLSQMTEPAASSVVRLNRRITPQRVLALERAHNVRDIGGYATLDGGRTRWGMLLRSSRLHSLSMRDHALLQAYEIRAVVDLRPADEAGESPDDFVGSSFVRYHSAPLMRGNDLARLGPKPESLVALNLAWMERCGDGIKAVFDVLTGPGAFPAVVHCTLGKDRTGLIVALLLGVLNVPAATIVDDYTLSSLYVEPLLGFARANSLRKGVDPVWFERMLTSRPETMERTLEAMHDRYGSASGYLHSIGIGDTQLNHLRAELREPLETEAAEPRQPN